MLHIYLDFDIYKLCDPSRLQTMIYDTLNCHWLSLQCWQKSFYKHVQHREDLSKHISVKVSSQPLHLFTITSDTYNCHQVYPKEHTWNLRWGKAT